MALRAKKPEIKPVKRAKIVVSGEAGAGKSYFALQFPNVYYIDVEGGAEREQYQKKLIESNGVYLGKEDGVADFEEVIKEIRSLATEKHDYKTLVIDSLSHLYLLAASEAEEKFGSEFGRDKKEANKPSRQLLRWVEKLDMNVVLICHQKKDWSNKDQVRTTYDAYDKTDYFLDLWLEIVGKTFIVRKTRLETFPLGSSFPREYSKFADMYGHDIIDRTSHTIKLATDPVIKRAEALCDLLNLGEAGKLKLFKKADVDSWDEMTDKQIQSCIKFMEDKINKAGKGK